MTGTKFRVKYNDSLMIRLIGINPLLAGLLLALLSGAVPAVDEIIVERVSSELVDGSYYVDARIRFNLDDDLREALEHGVELHLHIIIKVEERRKWLWDRLYKQRLIKFQLEYLPLSDVYIVSGADKTRRQFDTLENALKYLGTLDRHPLLSSKKIDNSVSLTGSLKAELSMEILPPPLKPLAFLLDKWRSDGKRRRWLITP